MKIIPNLETYLIKELHDATEINIAVALIKDYGLEIIENAVPATCNRRYLLGLDLPTPPKVLYCLLNIRKRGIPIESRIHEEVTYHPKVYIIKKNDGTYVAFIGSANATRGGLTRNREMNVILTDQTECKELLSWFNNLFNESKDFDEEYVKRYEETYKKNAAFRATQRSNTNVILGKPTSTTGAAFGVFPTQYFVQSDYDALAPLFHTDDSDEAKIRREVVRNKLYQLDELIFPRFKEYGIDDLHRHYRYHLTTSLHYRVRYKRNNLDAIWLHYGKEDNKLSEGGFTDACRMQVIIRNSSERAYIGIWLFIGKPRGSILDRENLKHKLANDIFANLFYQYFLELGNSYEVEIGYEGESAATTLNNVSSFKDFLMTDDYSDYYIIGREYHPNDPDISEENIEETVLIEFSKLYKLYQMITK